MKENKVPMYTGYRKCMVCKTATMDMTKKECPKCGCFLYPISQVWTPKTTKEQMVNRG